MFHLGESKRGSDIGVMMNLTGFNDDDDDDDNIVGSVTTILGGNFEAIYNCGFVIGQFPPTMLINMNMQQAKHGVMQHQPQMMYHM